MDPRSSTPGPTVALLIEDNPGDARLIEAMLRDEPDADVAVRHAGTLADATERVREGAVDVALVDLSLPDSFGLDTVSAVRTLLPDTPLIVLTGTRDEAVIADALRLGAQDYLVKGSVDGSTLARAIRYAIGRHESDRAMRKSEERHRVILQTALDGYVLVDAEGRLLEVNEAYAQMSGYDMQELLTMHLADLEDIESADDTASRIEKIIVTGEDRFESRHRRKDGRLFYVEVSVRTQSADGGTMVAFLRDITERKRAEEELRRSEAKYRTITENISDVVWIMDPETLTFLYVSPSVEKLRGFTSEEVMASPMDAALTSESAEVVRGAIDQRLARLVSGLVPSDHSYTEELEQPCKDGSTVWTEVVTSFHLNAETGRPEVHGVTRDITERRQAAVELRESEQRLAALNTSLEVVVAERTAELSHVVDELTEANEAKVRFLRSMSHELRTPLNSVIGFSSILMTGMAGEVNEEQGRQLGMINNSGMHLLALVNDVLDLSSIQSGRVDVRLEPIEVGALVANVVESVEPAASAKGLELTCVVSDPEPRLTSDPTKVRQILLNLLGNAIKFTEEGGISVRVSEHSFGLVLFTVTDTGPGIALEQQRLIFGEFERGRNHPATLEGTGLGLAISRGLAGALGGSLDLESEVGEGSTFTLTLPATTPSP